MLFLLLLLLIVLAMESKSHREQRYPSISSGECSAEQIDTRKQLDMSMSISKCSAEQIDRTERLERKIDAVYALLQEALAKIDFLQKSQNVVVDLEEKFSGGFQWHLYFKQT